MLSQLQSLSCELPANELPTMGVNSSPTVLLEEAKPAPNIVREVSALSRSLARDAAIIHGRRWDIPNVSAAAWAPSPIHGHLESAPPPSRRTRCIRHPF